MLIKKYQRQLEEDRRYRVARGIKWDRFFEAQNRSDLQATRAWWGALKKDGVALYRSGTQDKAKSPVC
jgi:hypothetical protein